MNQSVRTLAATVAMTLVAGTAWAYWSAGSTGTGGAAAAANVNQGATPSVSVAGTAVTVSWAASTLSTGGAVDGYLVKRYDAGTLAPQTILSACTGTIAALTCVESNVPDGSWKYSVTPVFATNWQGAESAKSATVTVSGRPVVTATVANLAFTENGSPVALDAGITVTDPDSNVTGATISMTTNYVNGQDTLGFSTQNGITGNWVAGTGVLTLTGTTTAANYQTALRSITYSNTADNLTSNNHNVNFVVSDAVGASNTSSRQIAVTAVNDGPVNTVPGAQSTFRNTAKVFSSGNGNLISVSDVDATTAQVQLVSTNGTTTLSGTTGLSFSVGDGTADATMTFTGTITAVNNALAGLSFNPTTSFLGTASLQIVTSDLGATGTGGTLTDNDTVTISVVEDLGIFTAHQDIGVPPGTAGSASHSGGTYTVAGSGWDIWDIDDHFHFLSMPMTGDGRLTARLVSQTQTPSSSNPAKAGVMFRQTMAVGSINGMMGVTQANGSAFTYRKTTNATSGVSGTTAGVAAPYWVRITRVGNVVTSERSTNGTSWTQQGVNETITMGPTIYVGLAVSAVDTTKLNTATFSNVTFEQPPVLAASGGTTAHTENVPVVVDSGITVTDTTTANMTSGTVTIGSGYTAGQDVLAFTNQNGITGSWSAPTLTLTGSATKANWQTALRSITYNNTSNTPNAGNRTINFVVNDGIFNSNTAAKTVSVSAVNDAPVNSVPGAQTTNMNTAKVFSTGNGNLISVTDPDAAGGTMQVQLVSTNGATTLSGTTGLSFSVGDGTADATMTFTGSFAAVNNALAGLSFNPTTSFTGAASLQIVTADQGNTGSGGTLTDNDTINITVAAPSYFDTVNGTAGLVNYYRLGESVISSDAMTGTAGATLQSRSGAINATWTKLASSSTNAVLTAAGRVRKDAASSISAKYVINNSPASADYTVEADLYVASHLTGGAIGIIGRADPNDTDTYYLARYEQAGQAWSLFRVVNNGWAWIGGGNQTLTPGSTYRLALDLTGTSIRLLVDGAVIASATDANITGPGRAGILFGAAGATTDTDSAGYQLDNFRVSPPMADSKGTNHGDYFGGVATGQTGAITGDANTAALFDGVDDYGTVPRTIQDDFSIEFWFKSSQVAGTTCTQWWQGMRLVDAEVGGPNSDFGVSLCQGKLIAGIGNTSDVSIVSPGTYNNNTWHHVVFTRTKTAAAMQLYVDGALVVSGTPNNTGSLTASSVITFGRAPGGGSYYSGLLDEVALYNTVLSAPTVATHHAAGTP